MAQRRGRWFRQYESTMDDPKVQMLSDWNYRAWHTLLCFASKNDGNIPSDLETISFVLRKSRKTTAETIKKLTESGLIDKTETGYTPHEWDYFQFKSDVSTDRVKRFRKRAETVSETVPETDTETESETDTEKKGKASAEADLLPAFQTYNQIASELKWPVAESLTPTRRKALKLRLSECGGLSGWNAAMAKARASPFLRGEERAPGRESWAPDIDFFLQRKSFTKLREGTYDKRNSRNNSGFNALKTGAGRSAGLDGQRGEGMEGASDPIQRLAYSGSLP